MADEVPVLLSDLENLRTLLTSAHGQSQASDIFESYRKLSNRFQWSAMTKTLEAEIAKVEAYIASAEEDEDES